MTLDISYISTNQPSRMVFHHHYNSDLPGESISVASVLLVDAEPDHDAGESGCLEENGWSEKQTGYF